MIVFGPVPSRRLGWSLGVNHLPTKVCTYACVYCQVGPTLKMQIHRQAFYPPEQVVQAVRHRLDDLASRGMGPDFITFVPDGEPTLDLHLGEMLEGLRPLEVPLAVITNASLIFLPEVQEALRRAHWVSVTVDAVSEKIWRRINRPHGSLRLQEILQGILAFRRSFSGILVTETMLVKISYGNEFLRIAEFLGRLQPDRAYLAVPTRPPAEAWVQPPTEETLHEAYQAFVEVLGGDRVEFLIGYEGSAVASTGDPEADLLSITAVHPLREEAVRELLRQSGAGWEVVERLLARGALKEITYQGHRFYQRTLKKPSAQGHHPT